MGDLSLNFDRAEFLRVSDGSPPPIPEELVWRLQALRDRIGRPLPLLSWYRNEAHQRAVSRARSSWHPRGLAVDIPLGLVRKDAALAVGFRGIGMDGDWVCHLDCRPSPRPVIFDDRKYRR